VPGTYVLEELNGTQRAGIVTGNRLKRFLQRENQLDNSYVEPTNAIEVLIRIYKP
jgi:hypothetical protein